MQPDDKPKFVAALTELASMKPGAKLTVEQHRSWWGLMQGWAIDEFQAACQQLARTVEFMPNPYHFEQLRKATRKTSGEAWAEVLEAVRRSRYTEGGFTLGHDIERAVRALGGYQLIGQTYEHQLQFLERRFCEHYEAIQDATDTRAVLPQTTAERLNGPRHILDSLPRNAQT